MIAFAVGHAGYAATGRAPDRGRAGPGSVHQWGGLRISEHGVWRVLVRVEHALKAVGADRPPPRPYERKPDLPFRRRSASTLRAGGKGAARLPLLRAAVRQPRAPSGDAPRSTWPPPTPRRSSAPPSAQPRELVHRVAPSGRGASAYWGAVTLLAAAVRGRRRPAPARVSAERRTRLPRSPRRRPRPAAAESGSSHL
jgi:hypothetical protein